MDFEEFYAERVVQFDLERRIFRDYTELISPDRNESHSLEWENRKLGNTAEEVKSEVSRFNKEAELLENQIKAAVEELATLNAAKEARNIQILKLSKLSNPVQRDITYLVEERFNSRNVARNSNEVGSVMLGSVPNGYKPMKTGEVLKLEARLQDETSKTTSYLQDVQLAIREAEEERHRYRKIKVSSTELELAEARQLYQSVDEIEAQSFLAISELLRLRVSILIAQREEVEQLELLQHDKAYFVEKEEKTRNQLIADMSRMQRRVKSELQECTRDFQKQLSELNIKLKALELREESIRAEHVREDSSDCALIEKVALAKKQYRDLRRRHALEMEGYQTETNQLKARLQQVDRAYNTFLLGGPRLAIK